ncbi:4407_t:CDS:1, partial [Ambispora leptoticha]
MQRKENLTPIGENKGIEIANSQLKQQSLVKIKGTLTSQIRKREEDSPYYYAFVKLKGHGADLPVIFKIKQKKCKVEPCLE